MNKEDKMIDVLLQEHARLGSGDDEAFLESLERRLDHEDKIQGEDSGSQRAGNRFGWGMGIAAALVIAAMGFYGWQQQHMAEKTAIAAHDVEGPVGRGQASGSSGESVVALSARKKEAGPQMPDKGVGSLMEKGVDIDRLAYQPADLAADSTAPAPAAVAAAKKSAESASSADAVLTQGVAFSNSLVDNVEDGDRLEKSRLARDEERVVVSTKEENGKTRVTCIFPRLIFDKTLFAPRTIIVKDAIGNTLPANHQYQQPTVSFLVPEDQVAGIVIHVLYIDAEALQYTPTDQVEAPDWQVRPKQFKLGDLLEKR
ncbi:MAG: hypothetical protein ACPHNY_04605 [Akkermansiaceae bacterium]